MENEKKETTICIRCRHLRNYGADKYECKHPKAPYTDFLKGRKLCKDINTGVCVYYEGYHILPKEDSKPPLGAITVDLTLNTEPFKKQMAELLAGL